MTGQQRVTDEQLTEWERLAETATEAPWSAADEHGLLEGAEPAWCVSRMRPGYEAMSETDGYLYDIAYTTGTNEQADAEFIAAVREALPALIADLRESRARETAQATELAELGHLIRTLTAESDAFEAERDGLQQRIDRAVDLTHRRVIGPRKLVIARYQEMLGEVRAALTGTDPADAQH